jgi:hypothetical protein
LRFEASPGQIVQETLSRKTLCKNRAGGVALSSNPSIAKNIKNLKNDTKCFKII